VKGRFSITSTLQHFEVGAIEFVEAELCADRCFRIARYGWTSCSVLAGDAWCDNVPGNAVTVRFDLEDPTPREWSAYIYDSDGAMETWRTGSTSGWTDADGCSEQVLRLSLPFGGK
jgi:hypothetical protein